MSKLRLPIRYSGIRKCSATFCPPPPPKLEAEKFNVLDNTNKLGSYTIEEINKGLRNRSISVDATILNPKNNSWVKVSEFPNVVIPVFHVMRGNETFGPYTLEELNTHFNSGVINEADMVLNPDTESWETIGEMDGVDYRQYYVQQIDETTGPYILPHIIHYLKNGDLDPSDLIKTENSLWMPMTSDAELHSIVQALIAEKVEVVKEQQLIVPGWIKVASIITSIVVFGVWVSYLIPRLGDGTFKTLGEFAASILVPIGPFLINLSGLIKLSRVSRAKKVTSDTLGDAVLGAWGVLVTNAIVAICFMWKLYSISDESDPGGINFSRYVTWSALFAFTSIWTFFIASRLRKVLA
jgi:hypothetical protein